VEVLREAALLAHALLDSGKDCRLSIIVPAANTMGCAMLGGISVEEALEVVESGGANTLIVLENDLARSVTQTQFENAIGKVDTLIALDCIQTETSDRSAVVLPVQAYVETNGTFVNNEGCAQRFYQVFVPSGDMRPSWQVIHDLGVGTEWATYEDALRDLAAECPEFVGALEASPPADWRSPTGRKIPRATHRATGRTAKDADRTMDEPRPPDDPATPFAFSMEGEQNPAPGPLLPRFWWPGWNSVNSVTRYQIEVNGPLMGGNPGKRLIEPSHAGLSLDDDAESPALGEGEVWLVPRPYIFGSEELSALAEGIRGLIPPASVSINPELAGRLGLTDGQDAEIEVNGATLRLPVRLDDRMPADVVCVPANFDETLGITAPTVARIARTE
jgi:NADH-quinone oxidoreductase subunit G